MIIVKNKNPLVSIMIPTYNRPLLFEQTLQSTIAQTYENIEILVNDNSTNEDTEFVMQKYLPNSKIRYFRNKEAKCKEDNFSPFEQSARGEYLQWCMDDDILHADKLAMMVPVLRDNPSVALVSSQRGCIDMAGNVIDEKKINIVPDGLIGMGYNGKSAGGYMLMDIVNMIGEPTAALFRRKDLAHHYWRADCRGYKTISDVVMWLELLEKGDLYLFREPLSFYRRHSSQEGQQPEIILLSRCEWLKLLIEYHEKGVFIDDEQYQKGKEKLYRDYQRIGSHPKLIHAQNYAPYKECMEMLRENMY